MRNKVFRNIIDVILIKFKILIYVIKNVFYQMHGNL